MIRPKYLQVGDKVGITCTARKVEPHEIEKAVQILQSWGLEVVLGNTINKIYHQFGGTDEERLADFQQMLNDKTIKAVFAARGGYGTVRIIDDLNFNVYMQQPKWLIGFSDFTYVHNILNCNIGVETIHAPMPITFENNTTHSLESLKDALFGKTLEYDFAAHPLNKTGTVEGEVIGGNLSILYSILGTKTILSTTNQILFIEDLDEYLYHIDRMMMAMKRANKLQNLKALIIGGITEMKDNVIPFGKTAEEIVYEHTSKYDYPICFGFPAGHISDNRAIVFGKNAYLSINKDACIFRQ